MGIPLTGTGGLFTRIGAIGGILNSVNTYRGTTVPLKVNSLVGQYDSSEQSLISNIYTSLSSFQTGQSVLLTSLQSLGSSTVISMTADVYPMNALNFSNGIQKLISQMNSTGDSVQACLPSASVSYGVANQGNPVGVISVTTPTGLRNELVFLEGVTATVSNDSQNNYSLLYNEPFNALSPYAVGSALLWNYPNGSGINTGMTAVDALVNQAGGFRNWLNNGSFESWSNAYIPSNWHIQTGATGTNFAQASAAGTFYDGLSSWSVIGDGATNCSFYQQFSLQGSSSSDNSLIFYPNYQFAINIFAKLNSTTATGVLNISLASDTSGTVINDSNGTPNSFNINMSSLTTSFKAFNGVFRTPSVLPSKIYLIFKMSTPLPSGKTIYLDRIAMARMQPLYTNGPGASIFSGNARMIKGDQVFFNVFNNYGGGFQILFDKLFGMRNQGYMLPSVTASPTISDLLIS